MRAGCLGWAPWVAAGSLDLGVFSPLLPMVSGLYPQADLVFNSLVACPDVVNWWEGSAEPRALLSQSRRWAGSGSFQPKPVSLGQSVSSPFSLLYLSSHP